MYNNVPSNMVVIVNVSDIGEKKFIKIKTNPIKINPCIKIKFLSPILSSLI